MENFNKSEYILFGLQRTGTNYVEQLINRNFNATSLTVTGTMLWKHDLEVPVDSLNNTSAPIIVLYKNPYTWFESNAYRSGDIRFDVHFPFYQKEEYRHMSMGHKTNWIETLSLPASARVNETLGILSTRDEMINIIKLYKFWFKNWIENFPEQFKDRLILLRYENLLEDNKRISFLDYLNNLGFQKTKPSYVNLEPGAVPRSKFYTTKHTEYYLSEEPEFLNKDTIQKINEELGESLFDILGYKFKTFV